MTKRELVIEVAEKLGFTQNEVSGIVQATLDAITEALAEGQRLEVRNFGVFEVKSRDARMGRNPRTGEEVPISRKSVATFKPGKALKELVQATKTSSQGAEAVDSVAGQAGMPSTTQPSGVAASFTVPASDERSDAERREGSGADGSAF